MKTKPALQIVMIVALAGCAKPDLGPKPPLAPVKPVTDVYFGTKVTDPYRYMEDLNDTTVKKWFREQTDYARHALDRIAGRQTLIDKMVDFDKRKSARVQSLYITDNDRYFYLKSTPSDQTYKLYYRDGYGGNESLLYDPATFSTDTTQKYVISSFSPSLDGSKVALEVASNGSESSTLFTLDVNTGKLFPERIDRCWAGAPSWLADNNSFLFNRLQSDDVHNPERELHSKTYLHSVGKDPENDREVFSDTKDPDLGIKPKDIPLVTYDKDSKLMFGLVLTVDSRITAYYAPAAELAKPAIHWKVLCKPEDEIYNFATTDKDLYLYTPKGAPNFKLLKTSLANPDISKAETIVAEDPNRKLTSFGITSDGLYYTLSENGVKEMLYFLPEGQKTGKEIPLPYAAGSVDLSVKGFRFHDIWVNISGWTRDNHRYRYQLQDNKFTEETLSSAAQYPEYDDLVVEELMVPSYDGTQVPLSLIYKKGLEKNGKNRVFFYGYGAYGISMTPFFSPSFLLWTQYGNILAIAHVRGGGELGDQWYRAGYKTTKPNTWKDLISCAEYMVKEKYTTPAMIAINSASAGGILIGRAMTERPDLFGVAIPEVGCLNALRMENSPNGPVNTPEFGTVKDSVECKALMEMDAYQHIRDGVKYPATLITAGMNDPRVIAWQPAKFAARLEAANASDKPILFLVDYEAGHGIGNTKMKNFESLADVLSFALWQTGHPDFQLKK